MRSWPAARFTPTTAGAAQGSVHALKKQISEHLLDSPFAARKKDITK
jgi:hypothetical protein